MKYWWNEIDDEIFSGISQFPCTLKFTSSRVHMGNFNDIILETITFGFQETQKEFLLVFTTY